MVIYAYLRVSTDYQDLHNQRHGILEYANIHALSPIQFVEDTVSGREKWESRGIGLRSGIGIEDISCIRSSTRELKVQPFVDPNPFQELTFSTSIAAKLAIAEYLARPLAKLTSEQMAYIDSVCASTLDKREVMKQVRDFFNPPGSPVTYGGKPSCSTGLTVH